MRRLALLAALCLGLGLAASPARADELVEAAKKERARREALEKKRGKARAQTQPAVLGNSDLKRAGGTVSTTGKTGSQSSAPAPGETPTPAGDDKDEAYWRSRLAEAQSAVKAAERRVQELNEKVNDLRRMTTAADDPNIQLRSQQDLLASEAELTAAQKAVQDARKGIDAVRQEARQAGAPPGWLR